MRIFLTIFLFIALLGCSSSEGNSEGWEIVETAQVNFKNEESRDDAAEQAANQEELGSILQSVGYGKVVPQVDFDNNIVLVFTNIIFNCTIPLKELDIDHDTGNIKAIYDDEREKDSNCTAAMRKYVNVVTVEKSELTAARYTIKNSSPEKDDILIRSDTSPVDEEG